MLVSHCCNSPRESTSHGCDHAAREAKALLFVVAPVLSIASVRSVAPPLLVGACVLSVAPVLFVDHVL